jgi:hypothetical protein
MVEEDSKARQFRGAGLLQHRYSELRAVLWLEMTTKMWVCANAQEREKNGVKKGKCLDSILLLEPQGD